MKSFLRKWPWLAGAAICGVCGLRAELPRWIEDIESGSRFEGVFFRTVLFPNGPIPMRRPPRETRSELSKLITATPADAELYTLRALEAEQQLDFPAAEADWKKYTDVAADKAAAWVTLADYYHRRLQITDEYSALMRASLEFPPESERSLPAAQQRPYRIYERVLKLVDDQQLEPQLGVIQYSTWLSRYPADPAVHLSAFRFAVDHHRYEVAEQVIALYQKAFPKEEQFPLEAHAELAAKEGTPAQALAVYETEFKPLWPAPLVAKYFELLKQTGSLRVYLERARSGAAANPTDLASAARLFYYWQQQGNAAAAERALAEFRGRKQARQSAWTSDELLTLARLYESSHNYDEAARNYYALYTVARADDATAELALGSLARLLLSAPEQPIHFGAGNLSLYRDVATMDPHPGFLNGVLSLLLNSADPGEHYSLEEQSAAPYFRRERAADLVTLFESRFPNSAERADLRGQVIDAYAVYGSSDGVIRAGTRFLADFPNAANRVAVAMRMADAYARLNQTQQEFATYDSLLRELSQRSGGVPLGVMPAAPPATTQAPVNSPDYARVLDRYVARLVSMKRVPEALAIYRRELDRNPKDPGLYDVLAAFLEQNKLGAETEQVYQRAIAQFQDHSWEQKLARWYLRQRRQADLNRLTRDVVKIFSGTELDTYFQEIVHPAAPLGPALYLQLNLYAHQRFPHHLSFVHNLLSAYSATATRDDSAYEALLRRHWYDAEDLRMRFFERLSRTGRLNAELSLVRTSNPNAAAGRWQDVADQSAATVRMLAEGEAWRGHFEAAAPMMLALETTFPADQVIGRRTAMVYRSLDKTDTSVEVEAKLNQSNPLDHGALTRLGELEADRDRFDRAATYWNRIPSIEPAKSDSYLEAATIFWDYYRYDDALRLLNEGRLKLARPALYAYEAGAIRENQRNYEFAVREYAKGAIAQAGSNSEQRLLLLARRPALKQEIDQLTANLASARNPELGALNLRVALLRNQNRRDDLEKFLLTVTARADAPDLLAALENDGRVDGFPKVQQTAIERQIAVATDPVERIRLRLGLTRFFEGQGQVAQGGQVIDAVYRDNPAILGVVRAAVDFHWRNKETKPAVDVLEAAAGRGQPDYRRQFTLEAARKSTDAADYTRARGFVAKLLQEDPERAEYIAVMADTYARQGDDRGLRTFYDGKIRELAAARHLDEVSAVRRALIPVLTRMKDFSAGVDQYIEVLNRFPEDDTLAREAALYASTNGVPAKLRDYYAKAVNDSPKDYRWPMVLARIQTQLEDFPAAIISYTRAAGVRPDRPDLLIARLKLEERLLRFDEAAATATKLYDLTYRNPEWMEKLAEVRARQGRTADAVTALNKAWIEGRSETAENFLNVAEKLDSWGMLADARKYAEEGLKRSPDGALRVYTRILTEQRQFDPALASLTNLTFEVAGPAIRDMGAVVSRLYTPEEKTRFAASLERHRWRIDLAENSGLAELYVRWLDQWMMANPLDGQANMWKQKLIEAQKRRMAFDELGGQLEAFDKLPGVQGDDTAEAAAAYRASGNTAAELRVLQLQVDRNAPNGPIFERYCQLMMVQPQRMVAAIARERRAPNANAMLTYVLQHAGAAVAQQAIAARGQRTGPLWTKAYTSLTGLYFNNPAAPVRNAFTGLLGDMNIGSRIGKPVDRKQQLAGDLWFYYGGRYGEYLDAIKQPGGADFLPAVVEATPGRSEAYFTLAEYLRDAGDAAGAAADYHNALDLNPSRADVHDRLAVLAAKSGHMDDAVQEWKLALAAFTEMMNRSHVPQRFWGDFNDTLHHIGDAKTLPPLRDDVEKLLRLYIRRNGSYQVETLLEGALAAGGDIAWIGEMSRSAADPVQFLGALLQNPMQASRREWLSEEQKDVLYRRIVESAQAALATSFGEQHTNVQNQLWNWQIAWADYLLDRRENQRAAQIVASLAEARKQRPEDVIPLELRVAARTGTLPAQLTHYEEPLRLEILRNAATDFTRHGDAASSRRVLEFVYNHELKAGNLDVPNFVGLAEIRLEEKDVPGAMTLLRRMTLVTGEPFSTLDPAAALLEKTGHTTEAVEFLSALTKAEPWNADAAARLAIAQGSVEALTTVAKSPAAAYSTRADAALGIRRLKGAPLTGSDAELALLSSQTELTEANVGLSFVTAARLEASRVSRDAAVRERLLRGAIAIDPKVSPAALLPLFRAALEARHDALAVAVGRQLLPQYFSDEGEYTPWIVDGFMSGMPDAQRVEIARGMGLAHQRMGELNAAMLFDAIAQKIQPADRTRRDIEALRTQLATNARNELRRPLMSDELDQDRLVRPKAGAR